MKAIIAAILISLIAAPCMADTYEAVTKDNEVIDQTSVKIRIVKQVQQEEVVSLSDIDKQLYSISNRKEALERQINALISQEVALQLKRDAILKEVGKVKLKKKETPVVSKGVQLPGSGFLTYNEYQTWSTADVDVPAELIRRELN